MSTSTINGSLVDAVLTELLTIAAVAAAVPTTTLSPVGGTQRMTAQHKLLQVTPALAQLKDENGDVLAVYFLAQTGTRCFFTQKGKIRFEAEAALAVGL